MFDIIYYISPSALYLQIPRYQLTKGPTINNYRVTCVVKMLKKKNIFNIVTFPIQRPFPFSSNPSDVTGERWRVGKAAGILFSEMKTKGILETSSQRRCAKSKGDRSDRVNSFNTTCDHPTKMHKINTDTDKDKERDILAIVRLATFETLFTLLII